MKKINILMYSMSSYFEWLSGAVNRNRQIVAALVKHPAVNKLMLVDYLPFSFKRSLREYLYAKIYRRDKNTVYKGLSYKMNQSAEGYLIYSGLQAPSSKILAKCLSNEYLVWSYNPMDISFLKHSGLKIFDAVDNWGKHSVYQRQKKRLQDNYRQIAHEADLVFTVSKDLKQTLFKDHSNCHWVPNGVDMEHYQNPRIKVKGFELSVFRRPIIGYVGVIQNRFDIDLAVFLAKCNPYRTFVYIGPVWHDIAKEFKNKLGVLPNVKILGSKSYKIIPKYIQNFDAAIIPHKANEFTRSMNPMKIYEYLACGKPVISTKVAGVGIFGDLVYSAGDYESFNRNLELALRENTIAKIQARREFVKDHTWEKIVERMIKQIQNFNQDALKS